MRICIEDHLKLRVQYRDACRRSLVYLIYKYFSWFPFIFCVNVTHLPLCIYIFPHSTTVRRVRINDFKNNRISISCETWLLKKLWYRVFHETWQLVNSFECLLPYTVLDIKDFSQFNSLKKVLLKYLLLYNQFFYSMTAMGYFYNSLWYQIT